jgi:hypothetical protein
MAPCVAMSLRTPASQRRDFDRNASAPAYAAAQPPPPRSALRRTASENVLEDRPGVRRIPE